MFTPSVVVNPEKGVGFVNPEKNFVAYVKPEGKKIKVSVISVEAAMPISDELSYDNVKAFMDAIPLFNRFNGVILNICEYENTDEYPNNFVFCQAVKDELKKLNIKHMFISTSYFIMASFMVGANLTGVKIGDTVLSCTITSQCMICIEFEFTKNGYKFGDFKNSILDLKKSYDDIRDQIIGTCDPTKIILSAPGPNDPSVKALKKILNSRKLVVIEEGLIGYTYKTVVEIYKRMIDKSYVKRYVLPTSPRQYEIGFIMGGKFYRCVTASDGHALPFSKTVCIPRSSLEIAMTYTNNDTKKPEYLQRFNLPKNGHRFEITLKVDKEGLPSYEIESHLIDFIQAIPEKLNRTGLEIPVISFFDNSTVISVYKEGKGYQFLESWNGVYGTELLVAFDKDKPTFFDEASEALRTKATSVITDITELMANPAERLTLPWPFKITRDAKNPVLIEFDNFDGSRKAATPVFLMALILKQLIKALKNDGLNDEQLKNIGFHFSTLNKIHQFEKWRLLNKNMQETCELLKINWNEDTKITI
uniref:Uncharacterized protein n=1 Tax=Panagrolaimus sp. ES5 TaxID=591445 RepID=A0AC34FEY5_9BILA